MEGAITMAQGAARSTVQGSHVVRAVVLAVFATAVLPPAGAWWLNSRRIAVTSGRVQAAVAGAQAQVGDRVLCGPGRLPESGAVGAGAVHTQWLSLAVVEPTPISQREPDAWGQCLLVGHGWVLSAGPNGVIETPFDAALPIGDDVGFRIQ